jgi:hypothetical protein
VKDGIVKAIEKADMVFNSSDPGEETSNDAIECFEKIEDFQKTFCGHGSNLRCGC